MIDLLTTQNQFLKGLESAGKSPNTLKNYRADLQAFNKFLAERRRPMTIKSFPASQAHEYQAHLEATYGSPNSIRRRVQALRLYFDFLVARHGFPENPIKQMAVAPKVLDRPAPVPFRELVKLKARLEEKARAGNGMDALLALRNLMVMVLIYEGGLKVSDLARLELSDVLIDKKGPRVLVRPPKRDPYSVPLGPAAKAMWPTYKAALEKAWPGKEGPKFVLFNGNPHRILAGSLSPRGTELVFEEIRRAMKIELTARNLRQACVFRWMCLQTPASQIKEWLGVAPDYDMGLFEKVFAEDKPLYLDLPHA